MRLFDNFFQSDGLQSNEFNQGASYTDHSGMLYFGGINGLNRFNPETIEKKETPQRSYLLISRYILKI